MKRHKGTIITNCLRAPLILIGEKIEYFYNCVAINRFERLRGSKVKKTAFTFHAQVKNVQKKDGKRSVTSKFPTTVCCTSWLAT